MNNCLNCKYYYCNKCMCKNIQLTTENNTEDEVIEFIEEGYLSQSIREELNLNRLGNDFLSRHIENGYIKKNCIDKALNEKYEDDEIDIYEGIENIISSILYKYFKGVNGKGNINILDPSEFCCSNWE